MTGFKISSRQLCVYNYVGFQVLHDLPLKSEVILYTGLSALQKKLYKAVLMKNTGEFAALGMGKDISSRQSS